MKQTLLKTWVLLLCLAAGGSTAWADNTVRYTTDGGTIWTEAADLNALNGSDGIISKATTDVTIELLDDQTISSRIGWSKAYTLTIKAASKDITIKGPTNAMWFLSSAANANIVIGSTEHSITLDGESKTHSSNNSDIARRESSGSITVINVTFKNFNLGSNNHLLSSKNNGGAITLENVTFDSCTNPSDAYIYDERVANGSLVLKGYFNVNSCPGTTIFAKFETKDNGTNGRIEIDDATAALTVANPISITIYEVSTTLSTKFGAAIVINKNNAFSDELAAKFTLANDNYALYKQNKDLKLTQAYTLEVGDAKAATLILPFASTIPSGISAYKLSYSAGEAAAVATEVEGGSLAANTPVLINTEETGKFKFISTETESKAGSGQHTVGALVGNYANDFYAPQNSYILYYSAENDLGFYKVTKESTNKVAPYRAYLTTGSLGASSAPARLSIIYDNDGTTGISDAVFQGGKANGTDGNIYNLAGQRVKNPGKGLYIVNGKKYVIK